MSFVLEVYQEAYIPLLDVYELYDIWSTSFLVHNFIVSV